ERSPPGVYVLPRHLRPAIESFAHQEARWVPTTDIVRLRLAMVAVGLLRATAMNKASRRFNCATRAAPFSPVRGESSTVAQSTTWAAWVNLEPGLFVMAMTWAPFFRAWR